MADRFLAGRTAMVTGGASDGAGNGSGVCLAGANVSIGSLLRPAGRPKVRWSTSRGRSRWTMPCSVIEGEGVECLGLESRCHVGRFGRGNSSGDRRPVWPGRHPGQRRWNHCRANHRRASRRPVGQGDRGQSHRHLPSDQAGVARDDRGKWGRIINVASTAATVGAVTSGAYCASKAGVVGLTRAWPSKVRRTESPAMPSARRGSTPHSAANGCPTSPRNRSTGPGRSTSPM